MKSFFELNEELHHLLLSLDATDELYQSESFSYIEVLPRVLAAKPCLEEVFCCDLVLDDTTQDASYYYFLGHVSQFGSESGTDFGFDVQVIFSNFGDLALVSSSVPGKEISQATFELAAKCLGEYGFIAVGDKASFGVKYDGHLQGFRDANASWGNRFFDYI